MSKIVSILLVVYMLVTPPVFAATRNPNLGKIYNRTASHHKPGRNPIIVIPGVLGSRLVDQDSGKVAWGAFVGGFPDPNKPKGARIAALPMHEGAPLNSLKDSIVTDGALDTLSINLLLIPA